MKSFKASSEKARYEAADWKLCLENTNYAVDAEGNVYSLRHEQKSKSGRRFVIERIVRLKGSIDKHGYRTVRMLIDGQKKHAKVHRLVANAFLDNQEIKKEVNHKNGNKSDNRVENLEWNTRKENNRHAIDTGLLKFKPHDEWNNTKVFSWDFVPIYIMIKHCGMSRQSIADMNNVSRQTIDNVYKRVNDYMIINGKCE